LTRVILPLEVLPSGSSTDTCSPTTASLCLVASSWTVTTSWVDVVWRIGCAVPPPSEGPADDAEPPALEPAPDADELGALEEPFADDEAELLFALGFDDREDERLLFSSAISAF